MNRLVYISALGTIIIAVFFVVWGFFAIGVNKNIIDLKSFETDKPEYTAGDTAVLTLSYCKYQDKIGKHGDK